MEERRSISIPKELKLKYTEEHEWARRETQAVRVGVTDFAQQQMGDIVFVELPKVGALFEKGQGFATLESVKSVSEVYLPISGRIIQVNEALSDHSQWVNNDPYGKGWIALVKEEDSSQWEGLLDSDAYQLLIGERS